MSQLGVDNARGIVVVHPDVSMQELQTMAKGGACGDRFTVHNPQASVVQIEMIEQFAKRAADLGWHVQLHLLAEQTVLASGMLNPFLASSAALFGISAPPAIGHARFCGVSCEMVGASIGRSKANASFPFAAQSARACSP